MGDKTGAVAEAIRERYPLATGWTLCATTADQYKVPAALGPATTTWAPAPVPGTVATAVTSHNIVPQTWDDYDWWYQCEFKASATHTDSRWFICFAGLATYADVWINGQQILTADNMFRSYEVDVSEHITGDNHIHIAFRSLTGRLAHKKPRPRWKTNLVEHQQLRWHRTTLLGRVPGWTPPLKPIGPWKDVCLEKRRHLSIEKLVVQPRISGDSTLVYLNVELAVIGPATTSGVTAQLKLGNNTHPIELRNEGKRLAIDQQIAVDAPRWWPHTHGTASLLDYTLEIRVDGHKDTLSTGRLGFKQVEIVRAPAGQGQFGLAVAVNGTPVFSRGACWTVNDIHSLNGNLQELKRSLLLARDAGVNMLRIGGTMLYEQQAFYALCDELGIMVWQDFMFANMDYPADDDHFLENAKQEITEQLRRLSGFACISVYCGNSEAQQQAAMFGMPADHWQNPLFDHHIPTLCADLHPGIPYFPSTPCEGVLPFHIGEGLSHFYAVGAYQRGLSDRIIDQVKFTPECLGFSNIPADSTVSTLMGGGVFAPHHPRWKAGVPRDTGTGWDFEDIRDHYLKALYRVDPVALRYSDPDRYLQLSRSVTGEVMTQVFSRWRASESCGGGLVWFFKDLVAGAGWGLLDAHNLPKATYYYLRRVWAKRAVLLTDNGLDGLEITGINETPTAFNGSLEFGLIDKEQNCIARKTRAVDIEAHGKVSFNSDALLGHFFDTTYNYRFGPPKHDLAFARLVSQDGKTISEAHHFPASLPLTVHDSAEIKTQFVSTDHGLTLTIKADRFLQCVNLHIRDHEADDNFFHLLPHVDKIVEWRRTTDTVRAFRGTLSALNLSRPIRVQP